MRDIQTKRFKDVTHVDKVVETDAKWRKRECHIMIQHHMIGQHDLYFICISTSSIPSWQLEQVKEDLQQDDR